MTSPQNRVALVTGASPGIGAAITAALVRQGFTVFGASRRGTVPQGGKGRVIDVNDDRSVIDGVAAAVLNVVESKHPKVRYAVGREASLLVKLRRLSTAMSERSFRKQFGLD